MRVLRYGLLGWSALAAQGGGAAAVSQKVVHKGSGDCESMWVIFLLKHGPYMPVDKVWFFLAFRNQEGKSKKDLFLMLAFIEVAVYPCGWQWNDDSKSI